MKLEVKRYGLKIIPQSEVEEAWIEEVLKLREKGDSIPLVRVAPVGLPSEIAYLETTVET